MRGDQLPFAEVGCPGELNMIGMKLRHAATGICGVVDAEKVEPDGRVMVRICDHWFDGSTVEGD